MVGNALELVPSEIRVKLPYTLHQGQAFQLTNRPPCLVRPKTSLAVADRMIAPALVALT